MYEAAWLQNKTQIQFQLLWFSLWTPVGILFLGAWLLNTNVLSLPVSSHTGLFGTSISASLEGGCPSVWRAQIWLPKLLFACSLDVKSDDPKHALQHHKFWATKRNFRECLLPGWIVKWVLSSAEGPGRPPRRAGICSILALVHLKGCLLPSGTSRLQQRDGFLLCHKPSSILCLAFSPGGLDALNPRM